jgi:prevent-host-death family protein
VKGTKPARRKAAGKTSDASKSIDEYLAGVPEPARTTLNTIRATIRSAVPPEAIEVISYRIPAFKYKGMLVWYGAFTNHCSLFPGPGIIEAFKEELKRYPIAKGTIQFPLDKPLPATLLKKIVKARVEANEKKKPR